MICANYNTKGDVVGYYRPGISDRRTFLMDLAYYYTVRDVEVFYGYLREVPKRHYFYHRKVMVPTDEINGATKYTFCWLTPPYPDDKIDT